MTSALSAEECAAGVRERFNLARKVETRALIDMVKGLGATVTSRAPGDAVAGCVEQAADGVPSWRLSIDSSMHVDRFRFVLCHELGHLFLRHNGLAPSQEERWCNQFAAELLMPHSFIRDDFQGATPSLATVGRLTDMYGVSRASAVVRLRNVLGWQRGLISLRWRHDAWSVTSMTAIPTLALYQLEPEGSELELPTLRSTFQTWLRFGYQRQLIEVLSECERRGNYLDAYINTADLARTCMQILESSPQLPYQAVQPPEAIADWA